jgi:hypothetical protein
VTYFDSRTPSRGWAASLKATMAERAGKVHYDAMDSSASVSPMATRLLFYWFFDLVAAWRRIAGVRRGTAGAKVEGQWRIVPRTGPDRRRPASDRRVRSIRPWRQPAAGDAGALEEGIRPRPAPSGESRVPWCHRLPEENALAMA